MTIKPNSSTGLPQGFQSPFRRVQMQERMDDSLACIATLTGKTLSEISAMAVQMGLPAHGPCYVDEDLIAKLLMAAGGLTASKYQDFSKIELLPDVAILLIDYNEETELGRHVVWHHVRGTKELPSFHYIIDPGHWVDPADHFTTSVKKFAIAYFIEVRPKFAGKS